MPKVRLVNPKRSRRRRSIRKARKRAMPAGLRAYWAKKRAGNASRHSAGGGQHMARKRKHHRRRRTVRRRRTIRHRSNPVMLFGAPRKRRSSRRHHRRVSNHRRRRSNPSLRELTSGSMVSMVGGGAIGFFGSRMLPQNLPFLSTYNSGITGYLLNAGSGLGISYLLSKFWNRQAGVGALVGTAVAVIARFVTDQMGTATPSTQANSSAAVSGMGADLDMDLGYYIEQFPFPQGASAGPYGFPLGTPYASMPFANTNASAVRAGQVAAQAALPAGQPGAAGPAAGGSGSWASSWS